MYKNTKIYELTVIFNLTQYAYYTYDISLLFDEKFNISVETLLNNNTNIKLYVLIQKVYYFIYD